MLGVFHGTLSFREAISTPNQFHRKKSLYILGFMLLSFNPLSQLLGNGLLTNSQIRTEVQNLYECRGAVRQIRYRRWVILA